MELDDRATTFRFLVRDRAGQLDHRVRRRPAGAGIDIVKIPLLSASELLHDYGPDRQNELTDRILIFGERHLRDCPRPAAPTTTVVIARCDRPSAT